MEDVFILPQATRSEPSWFGYPITIRPESGIDREQLVQF
jgi:CDP-6-deoxy-D-xylo-4-hexulose-3-dehydrase